VQKSGERPLQMDSAALKGKVIDFARNETRFRMVEQQDPARFKELMQDLQRMTEARRALYDHMATPAATPSAANKE